MNPVNEFEKYAVKHRGISSNTLNDYNKYVVTNLTPNIIEERPMNVAVMDVYSCSWTAPIATVTYRCTSIAPGAVYIPVWGFMTPCSMLHRTYLPYVLGWRLPWDRY